MSGDPDAARSLGGVSVRCAGRPPDAPVEARAEVVAGGWDRTGSGLRAPREALGLNLLAPRLTDFLEQLTTLIVVATRWDDDRIHFADELRQRGVGVKVIVVVPTGETAPVEAEDLRVLLSADLAQGLDRL